MTIICATSSRVGCVSIFRILMFSWIQNGNEISIRAYNNQVFFFGLNRPFYDVYQNWACIQLLPILSLRSWWFCCCGTQEISSGEAARSLARMEGRRFLSRSATATPPATQAMQTWTEAFSSAQDYAGADKWNHAFACCGLCCSNLVPISNVNFTSFFISYFYITGAFSSALRCWPECLQAKIL